MSEYRSVINLAHLNGHNGFQINGEVAYDGGGFSVASAGDVNGDGFADLIGLISRPTIDLDQCKLS